MNYSLPGQRSGSVSGQVEWDGQTKPSIKRYIGEVMKREWLIITIGLVIAMAMIWHVGDIVESDDGSPTVIEQPTEVPPTTATGTTIEP